MTHPRMNPYLEAVGLRAANLRHLLLPLRPPPHRHVHHYARDGSKYAPKRERRTVDRSGRRGGGGRRGADPKHMQTCYRRNDCRRWPQYFQIDDVFIFLCGNFVLSSLVAVGSRVRRTTPALIFVVVLLWCSLLPGMRISPP